MRKYMRLVATALLLPCLGLLLLAPVAMAQDGGKTLTVWWNKGYYPAEDAAVKHFIKKWEEKTGNTVKLSFYSTEDLPKKLVAAINAGNVPDVAYADAADFFLTPQLAWEGKLQSVNDVVKPAEELFTKTALQSVNLYNNKTQVREYYAVPLKQQALHIFYWKPYLEAAGYTPDDIPQKWDAFWKFWEGVQDKLRSQGKRVFALGIPISSTGTDNYYVFNQLLIAYGARMVNDKGQLQVDKPEVRQAAIKVVKFLADAYDGGYIPPGAVNWGDSDNNAAFISRQVVMTTNPSLSIPAALHDQPEVYNKELATQMPPLGVDGEPMTSLVAVKSAVIPEGAKHAELAKKFLSFLIQPKVLDHYLKASQGRWLPVMPVNIKNDPYWTDKSDPHIPVATQQEVLGATAPWPQMFNPAYARVNAKEVWGRAVGNVLVHGMKPAEAVDQAIAQIKKIFSEYQIPNP